jgi:hypothetical protein
MKSKKNQKNTVETKDVVIYGIFNTVDGLLDVNLSKSKMEDALEFTEDNDGETYLVEMPITLFLDSISS